MRNDTGTKGDKSLDNWNKASWYISLLSLPVEVTSQPVLIEDMKSCAMSVALWEIVNGEMLRKSRAHYTELGIVASVYDVVSFTAFKNTAIMCWSPLSFTRNFFLNLTETVPDFYCPLSDLPYAEFPGWDDDPTQFSPVCRSWFKEQMDEPIHNNPSDIYLYANEPIYGISTCAPVRKQTSIDDPGEIYAATCVDMASTGNLNDYFHMSVLENR